MTDEPKYFIWSNEHRAWWRAGRGGYSNGLAYAGVYSRADAIAICNEAIPGAAALGMLSEIPVRVEDVLTFVRGPGSAHPAIWDEPR